MTRVFKWLLILFLLWLGYIFIYTSPGQKAINRELAAHKISNNFTEGFENVSSVSQLFAKDWSRWHEIVLQNNKASIKRPIKHCLINIVDCYLNSKTGNSIELEPNLRRRGKHSIKFSAQNFNKTWLGDSRVALRRQLFDFGKGDDIYFSGWFYFEGPKNPKTEDRVNLNRLMIAAFRAKNQNLRTYGEPGPVLFFSQRNYLGVRFDNWAPEIDEAHQDLLNQITMPLNQWVEIKWHLKLSDIPKEGLVEVWLNDRKIIAENTKTLPRPNLKYSIFELGIGSNLNLNQSQTFYVDNLTISPNRFTD